MTESHGHDSISQDNDEVGDKLSGMQLTRIHQWLRGIFLKRFWTAKNVRDLELLCHFLYDIVKEDNNEYPAQLTWLDNICKDPDADTYAIRLLFVLICSKRVKDIYLSTLEDFVNQESFSVSSVIGLGTNGLKEKIGHLGMGNKNSEDIIAAFTYLNSFMEKYSHFPRKLSDLVLNNKGIGTKIGLLVLYFAFGQNDAISVDSHVMKCVMALKWVPEWCNTPEAV